MLTTITPFWGRYDALSRWRLAINQWSHPDVRHILVDYSDPSAGEQWIASSDDSDTFSVVPLEQPADKIRSIGDCLNHGALHCQTEWMMKLDLDMVVHEGLWDAVIKMLKTRDRDWFNLGALYLTRSSSRRVSERVVDESRYSRMIEAFNVGRALTTRGIGGTQFVCKVVDYLAVGGIDPAFRGYAWEDYSIVYRLNRIAIDRMPLSECTHSNVCKTIRDEIVEPMAREAFEWDNRLALLHYHHRPLEKASDASCEYKNSIRMANNKERVYELVNLDR